MRRSRWLIAVATATLASVFSSGCSSSTPADGAGGAGGGQGPTNADCSSSPADLCVLLSLADLNAACKASFTVALTHTEPFANGSNELGFVGRQCHYDNVPANAAEQWVQVERSCYGGGAAQVKQLFDTSRQEETATSEPRATEPATGIGEEAYYGFNTETVSESYRLVSRQGGVAFTATLENAIGSRDAAKACLADVLKRVIAAAPGK